MKSYFKFLRVHAIALGLLVALCTLLIAVYTHSSFKDLGGSEPSSLTTDFSDHYIRRGTSRERSKVDRPNSDSSSSAVWDSMLSRNSEEVSSFYALDKRDPKRFKILQSVAGNPLVDLNEVASMAESLPDGTRSTALAMISERCAKQSPDIFFRVLGSLPPGELRNRALQAGAFNLNSTSLRELVKIVSEDGDSDEIAATASEIKLRENSNDMNLTDLLTMALEPSSHEELRKSLVELGGGMSAEKQTELPDQSVLEKLDPLNRAAFYEGRLKKLIELDDARFAANLGSANLGQDMRNELIREWANHVAITNGFDEAIRKGKDLEDQDSRTYYETAARAFIGRDSMEVSTAIAKMPPSEEKNIFIECLVSFLKSKGDSASAAQWQKVLPPR